MRSLAAASLMSAGGAVLLGTLVIDYMSPGGFWVYISAQGLGFLLVLAGTCMTYGIFQSNAAWWWLVAASGVWLLCWSWFLHLGLFLPIPLVFWAAVASVGYLISVFLSGAGSEPMFAAVAAAFALGSMLSTGVMAIDPVFASDYNYIPFAAGALIAGIIHGVIAALKSRSGAEQHLGGASSA